MNERTQESSLTKPSRRRFLRSSAAAVSGVLASRPALGFRVAGSDVLRVGLVGCGGRGTGAATQALAADKNVKLVAMADAFEDRLTTSLAQIKANKKVGHKVEVSPDRRFVGFDAYQKLIDSGVGGLAHLISCGAHFVGGSGDARIA